MESMMTGAWSDAVSSLALGMAVITVLFFIAVIIGLWMIRNTQTFHGDLEFAKARAYVFKDLDPEGLIKVQGEIWNAIAPENCPIVTGERVRVVGRQGMYLLVEPYNKQN
ncbi:MAG: hypothetical protein GXY50_10485 [Syntrophomonadaceae bacterium]|nr:hypothetical protein [Syntrophomonadaceae bacterium]